MLTSTPDGKTKKKVAHCKSILARPTFALTIVSRKNELISSSRIPSGAVGRQGPKTRGVMDSQSHLVEEFFFILNRFFLSLSPNCNNFW